MKSALIGLGVLAFIGVASGSSNQNHSPGGIRRALLSAANPSIKFIADDKSTTNSNLDQDQSSNGNNGNQDTDPNQDQSEDQNRNQQSSDQGNQQSDDGSNQPSNDYDIDYD